MQCPECQSTHVYRKRRTRKERWKYAAVFECSDCQHLVSISHVKNLIAFFNFVDEPLITFHARCPNCGNTQLSIQATRDYVEGYDNGVLRKLQKLLRAPLCYCWNCRLQFHDLRPLLPPKR